MKKISLNNYKNVMSESEMKMVKGGASAEDCTGGRTLFTCRTIWPGGTVSSGAVCAFSARNAKVHMLMIRTEQDLIPEGVNVSCS